MTRKRTGKPMKQPDERGQCSREALAERICRAVAEGNSLHAAAARERVTVETLKSWLAEYETFRTHYEKARAIGRTLVLDDVLALADALPGTGRADIRLKLAARKWWAAEVWKTSKPETPAQAEARMKVEQKKKHLEEIARLEAYWEVENRRRQEIAEQRRREREANEQAQTNEAVVPAPKPESVAAAEPAAPPPTPASPKPQPRSIYDLSAWPPPKWYTRNETMADWDPFSW